MLSWTKVAGAVALTLFAGLLLVQAPDTGGESIFTNQTDERNDRTVVNEVYWSLGNNTSGKGPLFVKNLSHGTHNLTITVVSADGENETYTTTVDVGQ